MDREVWEYCNSHGSWLAITHGCTGVNVASKQLIAGFKHNDLQETVCQAPLMGALMTAIFQQ